MGHGTPDGRSAPIRMISMDIQNGISKSCMNFRIMAIWVYCSIQMKII